MYIAAGLYMAFKFSVRMFKATGITAALYLFFCLLAFILVPQEVGRFEYH